MNGFMLFHLCTSILFGLKENASVVGRTYKALVNESCKKTMDGGCMVYTYNILKFEADSVLFSYETEFRCTPKEREAQYQQHGIQPLRKYPWRRSMDKVIIEGCEDHDTLIIVQTTLVGFDHLRSNAVKYEEVNE